LVEVLILLAFGFWYAAKSGKRLNQAEVLKELVANVANGNEFKYEDFFNHSV
jgi:hypothetical protein